MNFKLTGLKSLLLLASVGMGVGLQTASATGLNLVPKTSGSGFSFSWIHTANGTGTWAMTGEKDRVESEQGFTADYDGIRNLDDINGTFTLEDGATLTIGEDSGGNGSYIHFEEDVDYASDNLIGLIHYSLSGSSLSGITDHSGTFYIFNGPFAGSGSPAGDGVVPNTITGSGTGAEVRIWANNWDNLGGSKPTSNALGLDLAFVVPDGGMSLLLLGLGVSGLGIVRRFTA